MTFEEIVAGIELVELDEQVEPCVRCEACGRLVRARTTAWTIHRDVTCSLYREAALLLGGGRR